MRYFLNTSAGKPVTVVGGSFQFEPVALRGGSWLGVLAVADDAAASALAGAPNTEEISIDKYEEIKKKDSAQPTISPSPQVLQPAQNPAFAIADHVARPIERPIANLEILTPVTLLTTRNAPPAEQLLAPGHRMNRPK